MPMTIAILEAKPERRLHVRQALEEMVEESPLEDPELRRYELYESRDDQGVFVIQQDVPVIDELMRDRVAERMMEIGTALRDELRSPIRVSHMQLIRSSRHEV
ncbi:MAG: antibiotic biosynthesis monooxygenase [Dehalococcoidia bacterium]